MSKETVLVVDDEETIGRALAHALGEEGYEVQTASDAEGALRLLDSFVPDLVLADVKMPVMDGLTLLREVKKRDHTLPVIMMTGYASIDAAVEAIKLGAYDYVTKPLRIDRLKLTVRQAMDTNALRREVFLLRAQQTSRNGHGQNFVGRSRAMREVFRVIKKVSESAASTVLIQGESGTGKELVARAIHANSSRHNRRFVEVNCAALTETLLEAELFGYEKGAFTGAVKQKKGLFEAADRGTMFLDEIGEMSLSLQAKLLRVLQEKRFTRVGGLDGIDVDTRIIASTNRDLDACVKEGTFREDLYYRLKVLPIYLPALRERREDIPLLGAHFVEHFNEECGKHVAGISPAAEEMMLDYTWPGNVRELKNVIERAILVETDDVIRPEHIMLSRENSVPKGELQVTLKDMSIASMEKDLIALVLQQTGGHKGKAAKKLGINRSTLYNKIREYGITG